MKKAIVLFLFLIIFFSSFSILKENDSTSLTEQIKLFNFYKGLYGKIADDSTLVKVLFWSRELNLNHQDTMSFIYCESRFDKTAINYNFTYTYIRNDEGDIVSYERHLSSVDIGLTQCNNIFHYIKNPYDPDVNLKTGLTYFKSCMDKSDCDFRIALFRYNAGDWNCDHNNMPYITRRYIDNVLHEKIKIIFNT